MEETRLHRRISQCCACLVIILTVYVGSYGPYLRVRYGADPPPPSPTVLCELYDYGDAWENQTSHGFYAPVEWLMDHTSAARPMFWWAEVCGAYRKTHYDAAMRYYERQL